MFQTPGNCSKVSDALKSVEKPVTDLRAITREFAARLRVEFASEIEQEAGAFKRRVVRLLKAELPPGPGRPYAEVVTRAMQMRMQGKSWREIYANCLPEKIAGPDSLQLAQSRLRSAVRARRNTRRRGQTQKGTQVFNS